MQSGILTNEPAAQQQRRLPVNPRREKVPPEQRKRVVRACNACNVRRVRCDGQAPCQRCLRVSRECEYPAPDSDKGRLKSDVEHLRKRCAALERCIQTIAPHDAADILSQLNSGVTQQLLVEQDNVTESADGRLLFDQDGFARYLGETSGATFLDQLKNFMCRLLPWTPHPADEDGSLFITTIGQYQTFDSRPLPSPDVDPLWLPARTEMIMMFAELRYYLQDGNGDIPCGGIFWWGDFVSLPSVMAPSTVWMTTEDTFRFLAFYHVCFALATAVNPTSFRYSDKHTGEAYFRRAQLLIGNPLDFVRFTLTDVPVLTMMAFYLIEVNRRDAAYMYVSLAIHIAIIHGAFRGFIDEQSTRKFWTLYILDRWLSVLMGRPPSIADEAVRLPLPSDASSMPPCDGLRAHVELSRISGYIVCETFRIAPRNPEPSAGTASMNKALKMLEDWRMRLPTKLQMPQHLQNNDSACCILHMEYHQLVLLTTRPILFATVRQAVARRLMTTQKYLEPHRQDHHIQSCVQAARSNIMLARRVTSSTRRLLQAGLHFVFNATVVLLLNQFINQDGDLATQSPFLLAPENSDSQDIDYAIATFEIEARIGTNYPRDCYRILKDLKVLTGRIVENMNIKTCPDIALPAEQTFKYHDGQRPAQPLFGGNDGLYEDMLNWVQSDGLQLHNTLLL